MFFKKRWSNRWQAVVSYNLSKAEGLISSNGRPPSSSRTSSLLGTYRLQPQTLLDLRSKIFQFKNDRRIEVLADIMNLLQENAEEGIVTRNFFSGNFSSPSTWIDPRRAMVGVKLYF